MPRIKINMPDQFPFTCTVPVRITDLNYGGHVGNDTILSLAHEGRLQYFRHLGYTELSFEGVGLIMADAAIEFKSELFYGDAVIISIAPGDYSKVGFDVFYKLEKKTAGQLKTVAFIKTGMICYDYAQKKITGLPAAALTRMNG